MFRSTLAAAAALQLLAASAAQCAVHYEWRVVARDAGGWTLVDLDTLSQEVAGSSVFVTEVRPGSAQPLVSIFADANCRKRKVTLGPVQLFDLKGTPAGGPVNQAFAASEVARLSAAVLPLLCDNTPPSDPAAAIGNVPIERLAARLQQGR